MHCLNISKKQTSVIVLISFTSVICNSICIYWVEIQEVLLVYHSSHFLSSASAHSYRCIPSTQTCFIFLPLFISACRNTYLTQGLGVCWNSANCQPVFTPGFSTAEVSPFIVFGRIGGTISTFRQISGTNQEHYNYLQFSKWGMDEANLFINV